MVLKILYDNIKDKSKVITNKCVLKVDMTDESVAVKTTDGSSYSGDILVGSDGIHSSVRDEMWRIANQLAPGWIPSDEHNCKERSLPLTFSSINPLQRFHATMVAFLGFPNRVRGSSLALPIQYSKNTNPT